MSSLYLPPFILALAYLTSDILRASYNLSFPASAENFSKVSFVIPKTLNNLICIFWWLTLSCISIRIHQH